MFRFPGLRTYMSVPSSASNTLDAFKNGISSSSLETRVSSRNIDQSQHYEIETRRVLNGHISEWWGDHWNMLYFVSVVMYTTWALISKSISDLIDDGS